MDLVYANASLHWLEDHATLFPRLLAFLRPGGCLAVQMPRNHDRLSHQAAFAVAEEGPWRDRLEPLLRRQPVAEPQAIFAACRNRLRKADPVDASGRTPFRFRRLFIVAQAQAQVSG